MYCSEVHDYLWKAETNKELSKSLTLSKENPNSTDICFTVDVYQFNDLKVEHKYRGLFDLIKSEITDISNEFQDLYSNSIELCVHCGKLYCCSGNKIPN